VIEDTTENAIENGIENGIGHEASDRIGEQEVGKLALP